MKGTLRSSLPSDFLRDFQESDIHLCCKIHLLPFNPPPPSPPRNPAFPTTPLYCWGGDGGNAMKKHLQQKLKSNSSTSHQNASEKVRG